MTKKTAIVDGDLYKYQAAAAGEKRSVLVTHRPSGRSIELPNRTAFYGHHLKKSGGLLADINKGRTSPFSVDEFYFEDIQRPEPIRNVLHTVKTMIERDLELSGADRYKIYLGVGEPFRVDLSTIKKYKDRAHIVKPILLPEVTEYIVKKFSAEYVEVLEVDDVCVIETYNKKDHFVIGTEKDFYSCPIKYWDRSRDIKEIIDCDNFGNLYLDDKGKVRGSGRIHFYFQVASQDDADCYAANSASDIRWGEKSAYKELIKCSNDKEALQTLIRIYKKLYPESKNIKGWRGDDLNIDWKYVVNENWNLARMLTSRSELENPYTFFDALSEFGLERMGVM